MLLAVQAVLRSKETLTVACVEAPILFGRVADELNLLSVV